MSPHAGGDSLMGAATPGARDGMVQ
jgi:hypothetical protein